MAAVTTCYLDLRCDVRAHARCLRHRLFCRDTLAQCEAASVADGWRRRADLEGVVVLDICPECLAATPEPEPPAGAAEDPPQAQEAVP